MPRAALLTFGPPIHSLVIFRPDHICWRGGGELISHTHTHAHAHTRTHGFLWLLGDGSVDVGDDDAVVPVPQVDGSLTATGALVLGGHAEHHLVGPVAQLQTLLNTARKRSGGEAAVEGFKVGQQSHAKHALKPRLGSCKCTERGLQMDWVAPLCVSCV